MMIIQTVIGVLLALVIVYIIWFIWYKKKKEREGGVTEEGNEGISNGGDTRLQNPQTKRSRSLSEYSSVSSLY